MVESATLFNLHVNTQPSLPHHPHPVLAQFPDMLGKAAGGMQLSTKANAVLHYRRRERSLRKHDEPHSMRDYVAVFTTGHDSGKTFSFCSRDT